MSSLDDEFLKAILGGDFPNLDEAGWLLTQGANVDASDSEGRAGLHWAWACLFIPSQAKRVHFLLDNGANVDVTDRKGFTPLHWACTMNNFLECARLLVDHHADVNCRRPKNGKTPLRIASEIGNEGIVQLLLENGADVKMRDNAGKSALDMARQRSRDGVVAVLEEHITEAHARIQEKLELHETFKRTIVRGFYDPNSPLSMVNRGSETSTAWKVLIAKCFGAPTSGAEVRRLRSEREELRLLLHPPH